MRINLTKKDLVNLVYMQIGFSKSISENLIDEFFSIIISNLIKNKTVKISKFGREIQQKLEKEGPTMSDDDKAEAQNRLRSLSQDIQFLQQKLGQMQEELRNQVVRDQAQKFSVVTSELMKAKGIKFLLRQESVLGWDQGDPSLNLTPEVIELLNQKEE